MKPEGFNVRGALLKLTTSIFTIFHISPIGLPGFCPNHSVLSSNVIGVMPRPYLPTNPQYQKLISPPPFFSYDHNIEVSLPIKIRKQFTPDPILATCLAYIILSHLLSITVFDKHKK